MQGVLRERNPLIRPVVVVSGAAGFIGTALCRHLAARYEVRALVRSPRERSPDGTRDVACGDIATASDEVLDRAVEHAAAVVHLAGRAHVLQERAPDPAGAYRHANVASTARVVAAALRMRVPRFILASTVKVNGELTAPGRPFTPADPPAPRDLYAQSKAEAERVVLAAEAARMIPTVLRLPLVYGPHVRGNFARLMDVVAAERRLPLGAIDNRRSLAYVDNVCSAIASGIAEGVEVRGVHFVADAASVSTPDLVRAVARALKVEPRLVRMPVPLLRAAGMLTGRRDVIDRLVTSLEVDTESFRTAAAWQPAFDLEQGLAQTAAWWRVHHAI